MDLGEPPPRGLVERRRAHLLQQLLDHRADPHHLGRLLDQVGDRPLAGVVVVGRAVAVGARHAPRQDADRVAVGPEHDDLVLRLLTHVLAHLAILAYPHRVGHAARESGGPGARWQAGWRRATTRARERPPTRPHLAADHPGRRAGRWPPGRGVRPRAHRRVGRRAGRYRRRPGQQRDRPGHRQLAGARRRRLTVRAGRCLRRPDRSRGVRRRVRAPRRRARRGAGALGRGTRGRPGGRRGRGCGRGRMDGRGGLPSRRRRDLGGAAGRGAVPGAHVPALPRRSRPGRPAGRGRSRPPGWSCGGSGPTASPGAWTTCAPCTTCSTLRSSTTTTRRRGRTRSG